MPFLAVQHFLFDYSCPRCGSAPRHRGHRILYQDVLKFDQRSGALLYFAPESNVDFFRALPRLSVKTSNYPEGVADYCIDILDIPFEDDSWDFIVCHHVIEHLRDDRAGLMEFHRILKPGGFAIVSVPMVAGRTHTIEYGQPNPRDHEHYYGYGDDFPGRIPACFTVKAHRFSSFCTPEQLQMFGVHDDVVFVLEKAAA